MRKKDLFDMATLINALNATTLSPCSFKDLSEKTALNTDTLKNLVKLIRLVREFSPQVFIDDENKVVVEEASRAVRKLDVEKQDLVYFFASGSFGTISTKQKFKAQGILASIYGEMLDYIHEEDKECGICGKRESVKEFKNGDIIRVQHFPHPDPNLIGMADEKICRKCLDKRNERIKE